MSTHDVAIVTVTLLTLGAAGCGRPPPRPPQLEAAPTGDGEAAEPGGPRPVVEQTPAPLPTPPQQGRPWDAPPDGDLAALTAAARVIFDQGLADPRGCEYRRVSLRVGSVWGNVADVESRGWVIPGAASQGREFVVAWNGLVYAAVSVGDRADLAADVAAMAEAASRGDPHRRPPGLDLAEATWVAPLRVSRLRAALCLRAGRPDLARQILQALAALEGASATARDPYVDLAYEWAWASFDRAVGAHMRGDDALALADARRLAAARDALEAEVARRAGASAGGEPLLGFLASLPDLLADQERRAAEPLRTAPATPQELAALDQDARVRALVRDLDQVAARQMGQPGGVDLAGDPVVQALVAEGDASVDALVAVLEADTRLTRSVHFWRDFAPQRSVLGVHEAAYVALANTLEGTFFETASTGADLSNQGLEGRRRVAQQIREFWTRYRGVPRERRWYLVLSDDAAAPERWLEAAESMVLPVDASVRRGSMFGTGWVREPHRGPGEAPRLRGEALRAEASPSVTQLLVRRVDQLSADPPATDRRLGNACRMASSLAAWDFEASLEPLRALAARCNALDTPCTCAVGLAVARASLGDTAGLDEYARWVRTVSPERRALLAELLEPVWRFPEHPTMAALARELFERPGSPWTRQGAGEFPIHDGLASLASTELARVPAYRRFLRRVLSDRTPVATLTVVEVDHAEIRFATGMWGLSPAEGAGAMPPPGTTVPVRRCDLYASELSERDGAPGFAYYWTTERRDQAIVALAAFLANLDAPAP